MLYKVCDSARGPIYFSTEYYCKDCKMFEPITMVHEKRDENDDIVHGEYGPIEDGLCVTCSHRYACKNVVEELTNRLEKETD